MGLEHQLDVGLRDRAQVSEIDHHVLIGRILAGCDLFQLLQKALEVVYLDLDDTDGTDRNDAIDIVTTTSVDGSYSFPDLIATNYVVRVEMPGDLLPTTPDPAVIDLLLNSDELSAENDFGMILAVPDFSSLDVNPTSATFGQNVSPRDALGSTSAYYFIRST